MKKILIVVAHPDDEIIGCGGTIARLIMEGNEAHTVILGEGITSRDRKRKREMRNREINHLRRQAIEANSLLGVKKILTYDFPDNMFDTVPFLEIVKTIEDVKNKIKPDTIFTHFSGDLNIDHRLCFKATITATRPMEGETVKSIYSFKILSSTEWNFPSRFHPNFFVDISNTLKNKTDAISVYKSEIKKFPHPRSIEGIKADARYWGMHIGVKYAEAFKAVRVTY